MISLDSSTKKLQVVLSGAKATNDCPWALTAVTINFTPGTYTPLNFNGVTSGVTPVDVCPSPSGADSRQIKWFCLNNADTAPITITVIFYDTGVSRNVFKATLQVGESLQYNQADGFRVANVNGSIKTSSQLGNQGTAGVQGNPGFQGFQGFQGLGNYGVQGFQGNQGNQGFQGWQGFQGIGGSAGTPGSPGATGNQGNQGFQGWQGWQGWQGPTIANVQARGTQTIAMAGGTTNLSNASPRQTIFTGSGTTVQTVVLPNATTLPFTDWEIEIDNSSTGTGAVTVQTFGGAFFATVPPGACLLLNCTSIGTTAGTWEGDYLGNVQCRGTISIATAGSTTSMTAGFPRQVIFTGTATQTCILPDCTTLPFTDWTYEIVNQSSITIALQKSGGVALDIIEAGGLRTVNCIDKSTAAGIWQFTTASQLAASLPPLPVPFTGLDAFGHSWMENEVTGGGGTSGNEVNSNDFFSRIFANSCGVTGDRYILHAVSGSYLTRIGCANGNFARALRDIARSRTGYPFGRAGNAYIICWGANDIVNTTAANQALIRSTGVDVLTVVISKMRSSVIFNAQGGSNLVFGANFSNAAAAAQDWTSGLAKQCTVVDSAGTSTVTFTIPVGYQGEPICFCLGTLQGGSLIVTWGGTAGVTGTTTLSSRCYDTNGVAPKRITNLTGANAGQTITCAVTTISGSTFYFDGVWLEAFKAVPVLVCDQPRLPEHYITIKSGAGVTTGVNTSFTDASVQFSNTGCYRDAGATLTELDAQGAFTANTNTIASVTNATTVVLGTNAAAAKTAIQYSFNRQFLGYSGGAYSFSNTNFTNATIADHTAADTDVANWNSQVVDGVIALFDPMVQKIGLDAAIGGDLTVPANVYSWFNAEGLHMNALGHQRAAQACWQAATQLQAPTTDPLNLSIMQTQSAPAYWGSPYRRIIKSGSIYLPDGASVIPVVAASQPVYTAVAGDAFAYGFYTTEAAVMWGAILMAQSNSGTSVVRIGIYTDTAGVNGLVGYPQTLKRDAGNATMSGAGVNTVATLNRPVYPGLTWLVVVIQTVSTASTFYMMVGTGDTIVPQWNGLTLGTAANVMQPIAYKVTGVASGALPNIFPSGGVLAGAPLATTYGLPAPLIGVTMTVQ